MSRGRFVRVLSGAGKTLIAIVALLVSMILIALLALQLPMVRHRLTSFVSNELSTTLRGRIDVHVDGAITLAGVRGLRATVRSEPNAPVIARVEDVSAHINTYNLLSSLFSDGPLHIDLPLVTVGKAHVHLEPDENGDLTLAQAFMPATPSTSDAPAAATSIVELRDVRIARATVRAPQFGFPRAKVRDLRTRLTIADGLDLTLTGANLDTTVPMLEEALRVRVRGELVVVNDTLSASSEIDGKLGQVDVSVLAGLEGESWFAFADSSGSPWSWRRLNLPVKPKARVTLDVEAQGSFESSSVNAVVHVGEGILSVAGDLTFEPFHVHGGLVAHDFNPQSAHRDAPPGNVDLSGNFHWDSARASGGGVELRVERGSVEGVRFPAFELSAQTDGETSAKVVARGVDANEFSVAVNATLRNETVSFDAKAEAAALPPEAKVGALAGLSVQNLRLDAVGTYETETRRIDGQLRFDAERLAPPGADVQLENVAVAVDASGTVDDPSLAGSLQVERVQAGDITASQVSATLRPSARGSSLQVGARVELATADRPLVTQVGTRIIRLEPLELADTHLTLEREPPKSERPVRLTADIENVRVGNEIEVRGVTASGIGEVRGNLRLGPAEAEASAQARELDLSLVHGLLSPLVPPLVGTVTLDTRIETQEGQVRGGHVYGRARGMMLGSFELDRIDTTLVARQGRLFGSVRLTHDTSWVRADTREFVLPDLHLYEGRITTREFDEQSGDIYMSVAARAEDFADLLSLVAPNWAVSGRLAAGATLSKRAGGSIEASWRGHLRNVSLQRLADVATEPQETDAPTASAEVRHRAAGPSRSVPDTPGATTTSVVRQQWSIRNLSADWVGAYEDGSLASSLNVRGGPNQNPVAAAAFIAQVPLDVLLRGRPDELARIPVGASLVIPNAPVSDLPGTNEFLPGIQAEVGASFVLSGTVADPSVEGSLALHDFSMRTVERSLPVSLRASIQYGDARSNATWSAWYDDRLVGRGEVIHRASDKRWNASMQLYSIPLGCFPYVRDYGIDGRVSMSTEYQRNGDEEQLHAKIRGSDFQAARTEVPRLDATLDFDAGALSGFVRVLQEHGWATAEVTGQAADAEISSTSVDKIELSAHRFQLQPMFTLIREPVTDVRGLVDGQVSIDMAGEHIATTGRLELTEGAAHVVALGSAFRDVRFIVTAEDGNLELDQLAARLGDGKLSGRGKLTQDGGSSMDGRAHIRIPKGSPVPISREGVTVAHASGRVDVVASRRGEELRVGLDIPELDVNVEEAAQLDIQELNPSEAITVGSFAPGGRFIALETRSPEQGESGTAVELTVTFGDDVWVHRGPGTFVALRGEARAALADEVVLTGQLRANEGQIDVVGRTFDVRTGTITLHGDTPPNPDIVAEAAWESPSGYTIIAAFSGPLESGKLTLRSEPPLSKDEILNVILFDDPEGSGGTTDGAAPASGVAASIAGAGLGRTLSNLTELQVSAGVDTSAEGAPRPELGVRLSPRVRVAVAYNPDPAPSLGQAPDRGMVSLDLRISPRWTLESTFGDRGSASADLVWRFRY